MHNYLHYNKAIILECFDSASINAAGLQKVLLHKVLLWTVFYTVCVNSSNSKVLDRCLSVSHTLKMTYHGQHPTWPAYVLALLYEGDTFVWRWS